MTRKEVIDFQKKYDDEFGKFEKVSVENHLSSRKDLCAFLIIDNLIKWPYTSADIITRTEHDTIFLNLEPEEIPDEQTLLYLRRCGVTYRTDKDSFCMFI